MMNYKNKAASVRPPLHFYPLSYRTTGCKSHGEEKLYEKNPEVGRNRFSALLVTAIVGAWAMFGTFVKAANSIEKLEDGLYSMEFTGDYGFDAFLAQGGAISDSGVADYLTSFLSHGFYKNESKMETGSFGCSKIYTQDADGAYYFGRNYDWTECSAMMVHTKPKNSYESVSTCCLDFLGFGDGYAPDGSMMERMQSIAAIYVPLDGMNSEGLMVADLMAGDKEETHQQTGKPR